jgi:hypothetical protein
VRPFPIKLMTDYGCAPVWHHDDPDGEVGPVDPADLPLSAGTIDDLRAWAVWYDTFLDMRDPADSRRVLPEEDAAFRAAGRRLWRAVRRELGPGLRVVLFEDGTLLEPENDPWT